MAIASIIKYEGDNSTFIWKHPCEDFNSMTQLIVHESQEAIFFMNGQALDLFGAGRHTLETQNIPKIGKALNRLTDGDTPFHCEVYFINKTIQMAIKWGPDSKIRFIEPTMGIPLELGACGELTLEVSDSRKLLLKLVGTMKGIAWGDSGAGFTKSIQNSFRPLISTAVKAHLVSAIKSQNIDILEIDETLEALSETLRKSIVPGFEEYGLTIPQFYITNVALPENDPNFRRLRDLHTISFQTRMIQAEALVKTAHAEAKAQAETAQAEAEASIKAAQRQIELEKQTTETEIARREAERDLIRAQAEAQAARMAGMAEAEIARATGMAEAEVMAAKGYTQKDVLQAEVQKAYAEGIGNMDISGGGGGSGIAGDMLGLGLGIAAAGTVAPQIGEMLKGIAIPATETPSPATTPAPASVPEEKCAKCGATLPSNAKFCLECGEKVAPKAPEGMIVCPECGNTVPKGKFCPECGHKFISTCPKCGNTLPAGAKFCLECGEKL